MFAISQTVFPAPEPRVLFAIFAISMASSVVIFGPATAKAPKEKSEKLATVCKKYRQEKVKEGSWRPKTAAEHEATHELMLQVFRNVEIATVTHAQARKFKEMLLQMPSNFTKNAMRPPLSAGMARPGRAGPS